MRNIAGIPELYKSVFDVNLRYETVVYDGECALEETDDFNILAIELLGKDLSKYHDQYRYVLKKKLSPSTILNLSNQMFAVIENLHKNNIIHRDIKPCNFVMGREDSAK